MRGEGRRGMKEGKETISVRTYNLTRIIYVAMKVPSILVQNE